MIAAALRPLIREARIFQCRWALAEMSPLHPDLPEVVTELRHLLDERYGKVCYLRRAVQWL